MKLLFLIGNAAVGKMTVGQELMKITGLRLFHNHMTIEPVLEIFGQFHSTAISRLRQVVFEEFAKSDQYGMIYTYQRLIEDDKNYRLESMDGEIPFDNYNKIDNTNLAPDVVAQMIKQQFHL